MSEDISLNDAEKQAMLLAEMIQTLTLQEKKKFLTLLDECPMDDTTKDKGDSLGKLRLLSELRKAFIKADSPLKKFEKSPESPYPLSAGDITVAIGNGISAYAHITPQQKEKFKQIVYASDSPQKSLAISTKMRQNV